MIADKLRKAILQAAIQGKLTQQLPEDGNAKDLVEAIKKEKEKLIKKKIIKKQKPLPPIRKDEIPFEIPDNWCWVRLGTLMIARGQITPKNKFSYIDITSIDNKKNILTKCKILNPEEAPSRARKIANMGDVLYSTVRPYLLNTCIIDKEIVPKPIVSTGFAVITTNNKKINKYLFFILLSPMFNTYANALENSKGVAYPAINDSKLKSALIPFPPLNEQVRIIDKLNISMLKLNKLKSIEESLQILNDTFPNKLKKSLLQAAIQGKLTKQLESDDSVDDLLLEIKKGKERLVEEKIIKKQKLLPPIKEDEIPFEIPDNWRWVRLGILGDFKKGPFGSSLTKNLFIPDGTNAIKIYEQKNAIKKDHTLGNYFISKKYYEEKMKSFSVCPGDLIVSCAGTIGEQYFIPQDARLGIINQALMRIKLFKPLNTKFFSLIFNYVITSNAAKAKGSAIKNIPPFNILKNILVPLPPLNEQTRIVKTLNKISRNT